MNRVAAAPDVKHEPGSPVRVKTDGEVGARDCSAVTLTCRLPRTTGHGSGVEAGTRQLLLNGLDVVHDIHDSCPGSKIDALGEAAAVVGAAATGDRCFGFLAEDGTPNRHFPRTVGARRPSSLPSIVLRNIV